MDYVSRNFEAGNVLRKGRLARGYSLEELSITTGLTITEIEAAERGDAVPATNIDRIAHALKKAGRRRKIDLLQIHQREAALLVAEPLY